ncbi:hypothetical protein [Algoriphagus confluentis]|uniref:Uncharacterized protein n=1 Tax=Algoriphagus confluentis TaxID=1697556 RepID=A0ABQ6PJ40_9BACT|nr:hypothetical protein Aconfl_06200 [Algoriphagus confluentis]
MEISQAKEAFLLISKNFDLEISEENLTEKMAIELLGKAIAELLNQNLEKLLQICYRVDLDENKLKQILHRSDPDFVAADLAQALWDRQKLKIEIRRRYSESK